MIDVSDGLYRDLGHILDASEVGARLRFGEIPRAPALQAFLDRIDADPAQYLLGSGEGFCLLAALPPDRLESLRRRAERADWSFAAIGDIVAAESGLEVVDETGCNMTVPSLGYQHFAEQS